MPEHSSCVNPGPVGVALSNVCTVIILFETRYSIPCTKSESVILSSDHHCALFLIHTGTLFASISLTSNAFTRTRFPSISAYTMYAPICDSEVNSIVA